MVESMIYTAGSESAQQKLTFDRSLLSLFGSWSFFGLGGRVLLSFRGYSPVVGAGALYASDIDRSPNAHIEKPSSKLVEVLKDSSGLCLRGLCATRRVTVMPLEAM